MKLRRTLCSLYVLIFAAAFILISPALAQNSAPPAPALAPSQGNVAALPPVDDVIFDNGGVANNVSGNEMTLWLQTEDFVLENDAFVTDAHIVLFEFNGDAWEETLEYFFFEDNGGVPGNLIASGQMTNADIQDLGAGTFGPRTAVGFDLEAPLPLSGGVTYWFGLHANSGYNTRDNVYWETGSEGFGSTGVESSGGTLDNWFNNGQHHWFLLTGFSESLTKEIVGGNDLDNDGETDLVVEVGILEPSTYDFKLTYNGPGGVLIEDAIPAEWDVMIPDAAAPLSNGNFETGDFTDWNQINAGSGGIVVDDGTFDPPGPGGPVAPFEGSFGSVTFQGGPGIHTLWRDVDVPEYGMPTLVWADHIQNWAANFSIPNQQWRVEVWDPADNSVMAVLRETLPGDPNLQDWAVYTADLSPWAGQTVRLAFTEQDNLLFFNARLDAVDVVTDPNQLNCVLTHANGKGESATLADCLPEGSGMTWFWTMARCHNNKNNERCRPTSCGALYLNDGAAAYEEWEGPNKKGQLTPIGEPFLVSNSLCLAAVEDLNGGGLVYNGTGDEDEDGIQDYVEACEGVTDVCNPDTDGDGVLDGRDECPLEGPANPALGEILDPNGCIRQSQCSDGVDNDDDGPIDYPDDASCDSILDDSEDFADCPCWNTNELLNVTAGNNLYGNSCSTRPDTEALIQNVPGSTPGVQGGFAADTVSMFGTGAPGCATRDPSEVIVPTTAEVAARCVAHVAQRCADIGDPIPLAAAAAEDAANGRGFE